MNLLFGKGLTILQTVMYFYDPVQEGFYTLSLLMTTQEAFVDSVDQESDCKERGVWSLIYAVHISHLN